MSSVKLVGLDFGTTTSCAVVASAQMTRSAVSGRVELTEITEDYRSEMIFTPLGAHGSLDVRSIETHLDSWLKAGTVRPDEVFGGGALLTGLTAQSANAAALVELIRRRLGDALVATADDPCLESWLAFMGTCAGLSRSRPNLAILNLDIGGGTTNIALGRAGEVERTGCLFVGARHVQVVPGTYRIARLSRYAAALLEHLGIRKGPEDALSRAEVDAVLDFYCGLLEATVLGQSEKLADPVAHLHEQVRFRMRPVAELAVTFSGGVGELLYAHVQGKPWPATTSFGDLGIDLAQRLAQAPFWRTHLAHFQPASAGRATVYGLLRHGTEISGSTLYLPTPNVLPLPDLPILGTVSPDSTDEEVQTIVNLVLRSRRGGCIRVELSPEAGQAASPPAAALREMGGRLAGAFKSSCFPPGHPVVLLLRDNAGKTLGHYATAWGALPLSLVVVDEVAVRDAQYLHIGRPRDQVVPVSYYGLLGETL
jgi:ethanolamine utilization protein EutA